MRNAIRHRILPQQDHSRRRRLARLALAANEDRWFFDAVVPGDDDASGLGTARGIILGTAGGLVLWLLLFRFAALF